MQSCESYRGISSPSSDKDMVGRDGKGVLAVNIMRGWGIGGAGVLALLTVFSNRSCEHTSCATVKLMIIRLNVKINVFV